ncbi:DUF3644 domain-containing protein [Nitrospira sp. T9]|uniref:DUF3644 domain-containing protein n=1 Tax=unclassified Nitrospira TaxID=2652172 RepID=UPI003F982299
MKREAKLLLDKACDSLVLSIELFNRPNDRGRVSGTLIQIDHSFEMLLKSALLHRGGRIREKRAKETIGFDTCVRRALSDGTVKFVSEEQALVLQTINGLRDAAQHHLLDISEGQLYVHIQSGVTLFRDLLKKVFDEALVSHLPVRILPVSTSPPTNLETLFESEVDEIKKLLRPKKRRQVEAMARLRPLAILDSTIKGEKGQPSNTELRSLGKDIISGKSWADTFKGVSAIEIRPEGTGPNLSLRVSKKEGIPIQLVSEGTPGASVVAVKRVNELDFYNFGAKQLAEKLHTSLPKVLAVVEHLGLRAKPDCYKEFKIGSQLYKRYSQKALGEIKTALERESVDDIWAKRSKKKT